MVSVVSEHNSTKTNGTDISKMEYLISNTQQIQLGLGILCPTPSGLLHPLVVGGPALILTISPRTGAASPLACAHDRHH